MYIGFSNLNPTPSARKLYIADMAVLGAIVLTLELLRWKKPDSRAVLWVAVGGFAALAVIVLVTIIMMYRKH